tara:strand:+ start:2844 stop:3782 length:939 start_codon:yes stop_codon:yes gene_type:complete
MADHIVIGIDCGASKVMVQTASFDRELNRVTPGNTNVEYSYSDHSNWNENFLPIDLDIQRSEYSDGRIYLTEAEINQGSVIIETILKAISDTNTDSAGLCFPGIKDDKGVVIMANGPRIPDLVERIEGIESLFNDSDCCVLGEWRSTVGKMQDCKNAIYIGGGTGIADGIILDGKLIDFNQTEEAKRSWELQLPDGSVESQLSPAGMINQNNKLYGSNINTLVELSESDGCMVIFEKAIEAFSFLIHDRIDFFYKNNSIIEKIVIGQRLGAFLINDNQELGKMIKSSTDIPIDFSSDRRTAALGAAWKKACS